MGEIKKIISKKTFMLIALVIVLMAGFVLIGVLLWKNQGDSINGNDESTITCTDVNCTDCKATTQREEAGTNENGDPVVPLRDDTNQETYMNSSQSTPTASNTSKNDKIVVQGDII